MGMLITITATNVSVGALCAWHHFKALTCSFSLFDPKDLVTKDHGDSNSQRERQRPRGAKQLLQGHRANV